MIQRDIRDVYSSVVVFVYPSLKNFILLIFIDNIDKLKYTEGSLNHTDGLTS